MALTVTASGTQSCTIGTEHTLSQPAAGKTYALILDLNAATYTTGTADEFEIRVKMTVLSGGTERLAFYNIIVGAQDAPIKVTPPVPCPQASTWTIKQTAGTGRSVPWSLVTPD